MKRLFSLFLSLVMLSSAVLCTDLSAYADSNAKSDSYFNQFTDGNETEEAISYIDDEIDLLFDYVIKQVFSGVDNMSQYINNYDGQTPTYDFMALVSGLISSALVGENKADIIYNYDPFYVPFDNIYYSYLDSINYNNCNFGTLYNISHTDFPDNPDVQQFADELSKYLDSNLNAYKSKYESYNNEYNKFLEIENLILDNYLDEEGTIFYLTSDNEANELISKDGISISEFEKSYDVSKFINYVQSILSLYDSSLQINSLSEAVYYCFSTSLVYLYPIIYSLGDDSVLEIFGYNTQYDFFRDNLNFASETFTTSKDGYYTDIQKNLVETIFNLENNTLFTGSKYSITENDFVQIKNIFNNHLTKTATISAINDSDLDDLIKYYFNNYLTNDLYKSLNSDLKNWVEGSSYTLSMVSLENTINNEIYYPYIINEYFNVDSKSLNLIDLFHEYGQYGCFIKDNLVCTENNKFDLDLSSNQSKEIWINITNELINNIIENYISSDTQIGSILNNVLNSLLSVDINLEKNLPDVYLRFAERPSQTVLELLPTVLTILDDVAVPVLFNAEGDNYYQVLENLLLREGSLLYNISQESGSEIGLGQIGWDLNTVLPDLLDFLSDSKTSNEFEVYSEPYDSSVFKITNIYIVDKALQTVKRTIKEQGSFIEQIIIFAKEIIDRYLGSTYANNVKLNKDNKRLNSGLNNIFVALPQLIEIIENNFAAKIKLDKNSWSYLDEGAVIENDNGSFENGLLKTFKNTAANPDSKTTLNILSNDFLAKVFNKIIFFGNVLFTEENNLSKNAPFIFSVVNCFDAFGENSPLVYALNNAFDLNSSNCKFTLPEISGESVLFLLSNIEKIIGLIDYAQGNPNNPDPSSVLPDNNTSETIQSMPEEIIALIDNAFEKDINDLSSVIMKDLQYRLEQKDDKAKAKAQDFADETEALLNAYLDVINNNNVTNSNLNTVINGIYTVAEKYCDFTFASEMGGVNPLSDFITKLVLGAFSPAAVSTNIDNTAISSELVKYDTWDQLKKSKVELEWGLTGNTTIDFFNAVCNGFPRINKVADIIVNDTDLYSNYITAIYNKFEISLPEDSINSSLSKIITPPLVGFKETLDNGVFSSILLNFENIEYFGKNIETVNGFVNSVLNLTINELISVGYTLFPNLISNDNFSQSITSETYFNTVSSFVNNIFVNVADSENILELKSIELKPYYYEIDIAGLSKVEIYEQLFCKHLYTQTIVKPTCTTQGYTKYNCLSCGNEYFSDYVDALGHNYVYDNEIYSVCDNCHEAFMLVSNGLCYQISSTAHVIIIDYQGSDSELDIQSFFEDPIVSIETYAFEDCSILTSMTIPKSVTKIGYNAFNNCYNLSDVYFAGSETEWNNIVIEDGNWNLTNATIHFASCTHIYDSGTVLKEATCTTDGQIKYTCTLCSESYTEIIPAIGHNYVNDICTNCGEEFLTINNFDTKKIDISTEGEYKYIQFIPSNDIECIFFSSGDYDTYGYIYDSEMNELVQDDDSGDNRNFQISYNFESGNTYYLGVRFYNNSTTGTFNVTLCSHEYDTEKAVVIEPTCVYQGYTKNTCVHCGYVNKTDYVEPLPHSYAISETVDATCDRQGYVVYTCENCSQSYNEYTDALVHNFVDGVCDKCGMQTEPIELFEVKDVSIKTTGEYKYFSFVPTENISYTFMTEGNIDTVGCLYDENMLILSSDDDSGNDHNFYLSTILETGKIYYCSIKLYSNDDTGNFKFTVEKTCQHDYSEEVIVPTCTENGYTKHTCQNCGKEFTDNYTSAIGHNYSKWKLVTEVSCTGKGIEESVCANCGDVKTKETPALGHNWDNGTITTEPTCTSTGIKTYTCERCLSTKTEIVGKIKHTYKTVITEPTCTQKGFTTYTCSVCNEVKVSDYVDALGHDEVIDKTVAPTCSETGLTEGKHCSRCNEILVKQETVKALGHSFTDYVSDSNATCTKDGTKTAKCDRCEVTNTITDIGSALGHIEVIDKAVAPTCTKTGLTEGTHCSRCNEILIKQEKVNALGHNWNDGVITKGPTCTQTGIKTFTCLRCSNTKTEPINKTEHLYTPKIVAPTCTQRGYTIYVCDACSTDYISDYVDALGHNYSDDWTIDKAATCTSDGLKSHHCSRCDSKTDITVIEATGHSYGKWQTRKAATCTDNGIDYKTCSVCRNEEVLITDSLGHNYEKWNITKEATVLCEGIKESSCTRCGNVETRVIDKVEVDLNTTDKYGLANFTVVNAQTKEPIKDAGIFISTENDGENTFFTDQNGKVSIVLPVGKQVVSAYAEGCLTRNLNINVTTGNNEIPLIGLSEKSTYDAKIDHHLMTSDEIADAGIDTSDTGNQHVYKYELKLQFEPEIDWFSLVYYMDEDGELIGGSSNSGESAPNYVVDWVVDNTSNNKGHFNVKPENGEEFSVYPVSEYFYLIIRGEVKWLKEMFDVEMLVINNSNTDTLENLSATLNLPEGLSLAAMSESQQTLEQYIGNIDEGCSKSVHWYVRGDKAGSYSIEANLRGMVMPFEEEINDNFIADKSLQVWAGNAMHLEFEFPDAAYYGDDYPITITLTNVSDTTLYNIRNFFQIEQGMEIYYSDSSSKKKIEKSQWDSIGIREFNPGDKIIIESTVNVFFKSDIMERELEKYIGIIDCIEQFIKGFKAVKEAFDIVDGLINVVGGAITGIDLFIESSAEIGEKISLISTLKNTIFDFQSKYSKTGSATFDSAVKLANSGVGAILNALSENPDEWLENASEKDIKDLIDKVETLGESISSEPTAEDIKNFNIFDSLRTMVSAIPIRFALKSVIMTEDENNTTSIPWSYNQYNTGAHYFGVSDLGNYMINIAKAIMAEVYDEAVPSTLKLIPGLDDPLNYEDVKRQIIATENEIKQFQAKTATGDVSFKAYIVRNENTSIFSLKQKAFDDFIISCDNKTAVLNNGVLTFTGNGIISITPTSLNGGTLYIEDSEGNTYTYEISVVKQHECSASEWHTVISPTAEIDGFAVKCCDVCEDILDVELLSAENCTHNFDTWKIESDASCSSEGLKSRECSVCGYRDFEFIKKENHDYQSQSIEYTDNKKITTYKCSVCGEIFATSLDCEAYLAAVETANALKQNGLEKYTDAAIEDFNSAIAYAKEIADLAENTDDFDNATRIVLSAISTLKENLLHFTITYITIIENDKTKTTFVVKYGDEFVVPKTDNAIIKITYNNGNGETDLPISNSIGFIATEDATVTVYMADDDVVNNSDTTKVTFLNMGGSIFAINYIANHTVIDVSDKNISFGDTIVSAPIVAFYDFIGWEVVSGNVNNPDGNDIVLRAAYKISNSRNICNIVGLNGVLVNGESSYLAHYDELVKISCSKGKKLAYTDNTGTEIYAYINGNTIYAPNSANIYIKEVDNAIEAKSAIVGTYNENGRAGFNCQFSLPEDAVFVECGVVITTNNDIANNNFEIGTDGTSKFKSNTQGNNNEYSVSLKYSSSYYGKTLYGRSYLIYKDTDGNLCTVYSVMNSINL